MEKPLEIGFTEVEKTPALEPLIRNKARQLERVADHLIGCRVAVEKPHENPSSGIP